MPSSRDLFKEAVTH